ncbi:SHOCT domain-containing protein [Rivibacter subsaxonicus]|uniref:Putative oligomerization/nucleic acid binding protein n=1 Tax=Rivibacter subsaxonicus TaxID=457575 RepID=A0A4V2FU98_9BURK|nr:SHOCT domain-containing protein [Rivibacter subsaxonicus]RZU01156.1 putative oligomerization/nucleic acid binding protein [Rivibacter subsaxonicus]
MILRRAAKTAGRTALIVKTAEAVSRPRAAAPQPVAAMPPAAAAAAPAGGLTPEKIETLKKLAELKTQGILSEAEFEVEKAKLLHG